MNLIRIMLEMFKKNPDGFLQESYKESYMDLARFL